MTLIDFGDFKLRFDPKEVRINIDGDLIDIGARREEPLPTLYNKDIAQQYIPNNKGGYDLSMKLKEETQ